MLSLLTELQQIGEDASDVCGFFETLRAVLTPSETDCTIKADFEKRFYSEVTLALSFSGTRVAEILHSGSLGYCWISEANN